MARTLDQFIAFTTDSVGIERILRLLQALAQVFASCALPFELLLTLIATWTGRTASPELTLAILMTLKKRFNITRRFFRVFRFVESFRDAQTLYSAAGQRQGEKQGGPVGADVWLDILGKTFNGMYLLLEASTTIDVLDIEGLTVWDHPTRTSISIEAQRFWLFSLVCGMLSGLWKMFCLMAYAPVPQSVAVGDAADATRNSTTSQQTEESTELVKDEKTALKEEQARLRKAGTDREAHARKARVQMYKLGRGTLACAFDIAIPGAMVGWLNLDDGTVGLAMVVSTILTGMAVWEKCGEKL